MLEYCTCPFEGQAGVDQGGPGGVRWARANWAGQGGVRWDRAGRQAWSNNPKSLVVCVFLVIHS